MLQYKTLKFDGFIHPFVMNNLPTVGVVKNAQIDLHGMVFTFKDEPYAEGTEVMVNCQRDFMCVSQADLAREKVAANQRREEINREFRFKRVRRRLENQIFNKRLKIPVLWSPDIKIVMSGLQENSMCNGTFKNSVVHVVLREGLTTGALKRNANDYLCSTQKSCHSVRATEFWGDKPPRLGDNKVSCKKCLEICRRWQ